MLFYLKFRPKETFPIKQEFSEKTEHNQVSTNFLALCSHTNFDLSETPTFKYYNSCILLWLAWSFQDFYV